MSTSLAPICRHHRRTVKREAARIAEELGMDYKCVSIVSDENGLPEIVQKQIVEHDAIGEIAAVLHMDTIYIVSNKISTTLPLTTVFRHEMTHLGAKKLLGKAAHCSFNRLLRSLGGLRSFQKRVLSLGLAGDMLPYLKTAISLKLRRTEKASLLMNEFLAILNSNHQLHVESNNRFLNMLPTHLKRKCSELWGWSRDQARKTGLINLAEVTDADIAYILRQLTLAAAGKPSEIPVLMMVDNGDEMTCFFSDLTERVE